MVAQSLSQRARAPNRFSWLQIYLILNEAFGRAHCCQPRRLASPGAGNSSRPIDDFAPQNPTFQAPDLQLLLKAMQQTRLPPHVLMENEFLTVWSYHITMACYLKCQGPRFLNINAASQLELVLDAPDRRS